MDGQRADEIGQQFAEALHAVDQKADEALERMVAFYSPEARLSNTALKLAGEERVGHAGVRAFWEAYQAMFQQASTEFFELTSSERAAGLFWTTRGTDATGEPFAYDGVSLLVFDDAGKIILFRGYYDSRELSRKVSG